jgi:2'-5' RNA ligase
MQNPIDEYKYSIQLFFDEDSENLISAYNKELRSKGLLNADFIDERYRPHISLAVYRELEQEYSEKALQILADRFTQFQLNFSHIGIFNVELKVLYLGPTFSTTLRNLHRSLHTLYVERPEKCWDYYLPDNWVPHCGVMIDTEFTSITQGLGVLMSKTLPQVRVTSIAATGFAKRILYLLNPET